MTALKQRSSYAAAAHVLRTPSLSWVVDGKLNDDSQFIMWEEILERYDSLSGGEQALVDIAREIWRDSGMVQLNMGAYDEGCWERVIEALLALRPLPTVRSASSIADEAIELFIERLDNAGVELITGYATPPRFQVDPEDLAAIRAEAVQEIREGMAVREEDIR